jgi:hypothetical protein
MASINQKHFKAGGGEAAVKKLLAEQAAAARQLTGASQAGQQTAKPTEAQLARLRAKVAARGKRELDRQSTAANRKEASETTYSGNKVYRNGKHIGNMVNGKLVKLNQGSSGGNTIRKVKYPVQRGTVEEKKSDPPKTSSSTPTRTNTTSSTPPRTTNSSTSNSSSSSTPTRRKPTGQGSQGFRMKANLGSLLTSSSSSKPKTSKPTPSPSKPKNRLADALKYASDSKNKDDWMRKRKK